MFRHRSTRPRFSRQVSDVDIFFAFGASLHLCIVQVMFTAFLSSNVDLHLGGPGRTPPSRALLDRVLGGQPRRNTHLVIDLIFKMEGTGQIDC